MAYAGIISEVTLKAMQGVDKDENQDAYELLEDERNVMLQRITVLQAVREVGVFRADIYADSSIKVKYTMDSSCIDMESIKNAETILTTYFGGYSVAEESGKFVLDETKGEARKHG